MTQDPKIVPSGRLSFNEERCNKMIEEVEDYAILLLNRDGQVETWNKGAQKIKGYTAEEIIGENFRIFYSKSDQLKKKPEMLLEEAAQTGKAIDEGWRMRKDGTSFWGSVNITALHDDGKNVIGFTKVTRDLTERKNREEELEIKVAQRTHELQLSENKFRSLVENQYTIILLKNEKFETIYESPSSQQILGWTTEERAAIGSNELTHPDDRENLRLSMKRAYENPGVPVHLIVRSKHKNGNYITLEGVIVNKLNDPNIKGIITNLHDITQRREAEEKSENNHNRLQQAQALAHVGSWQLDFATQLGTWSDETCRIYGLPVEENLQSYSAWSNFIHPEDLERVKMLVEESMLTRSDSSIFHRIVCRNGMIKHVLSEAKFEFDSKGNPIGLYGVVHDLTEKKAAEQQKEFLDHNTKALINNTDDLMWSVDREMNLITCNQSFGEMFKLMTGEPLKPGDSVLSNLFSEEQLIRWNELYNRAFSGEIFKDVEYNDVPTESWSEISFYPIRNGNEIIGTACYGRDITELKQSADKLTKANKELETFIYKSSHDLRGPLSSLLGLITVAKMELKEEKTVKYLDAMTELTQKLDNVMTKLVKVMALNNMQLVLETVDMKVLLDEILHSLEFIKGFDRIKFNIDNQLNETIYTDRDSMFSIMLNLIENAVKYSRHELSDPEINVSISKDDKNNVLIKVADNGIGIEEEAKDKIFDMFYRATNKSKGSGLGLYLVKSTIEKLGGTIALVDENNMKTTFKVKIPMG